MDTIQSKSGKFVYTGKSETLEPVVIYLENGNAWVTVWVQNGEKYFLNGDADYPELISMKGGETNKLLEEFKVANKSLIKEKCDLRDKIVANPKNSHEVSVEINESQLLSQIKNIDQLLKEEAEDFVVTHPSSVAALVLIQDYIMDVENVDKIQSLLSLITGEAKETKLYEKMATHCAKFHQPSPGSEAPDFNVLSLTKKDTIRLDTFKNKYLLINFAASWCVPCEPEFLKLLAVRNAFPKEKLELLTISLDENTADWEKLAKEKNINWTQVVEANSWDSQLVELYNVSAIPCNYLIDRDGKVIASKVSVDSIKTVLNEKLKIKK
jgi:peroxiredoxin